MIIGIGTDLCDIRRIERALLRFEERFTNRIFDSLEREKAERKHNPAYSYAQSFAAKEACAKALGTGFRKGVFWKDITVCNLETGQPYIKMKGGAFKRLQLLTPPGMEAQLDVSQSDEYPIAHAIVIISANPIKPG